MSCLNEYLRESVEKLWELVAGRLVGWSVGRSVDGDDGEQAGSDEGRHRHTLSHYHTITHYHTQSRYHTHTITLTLLSQTSLT
jgi:hypothetical protein